VRKSYDEPQSCAVARPWNETDSTNGDFPISQSEGNLTIAAETLALFVRFWLTTTLPSGASADAAAQAKGRQRRKAFLQAGGPRLAKDHSFMQEVSQDVQAQQGDDSASKPDGL
jgi:hypothetical protein